MTIDEAIEHLKELKAEGTEFIIFEAWPAGFFEKQNEDPNWGQITNQVMFEADWTTINETMQDLVEEAEEALKEKHESQ